MPPWAVGLTVIAGILSVLMTWVFSPAIADWWALVGLDDFTKALAKFQREAHNKLCYDNIEGSERILLGKRYDHQGSYPCRLHHSDRPGHKCGSTAYKLMTESHDHDWQEVFMAKGAKKKVEEYVPSWSDPLVEPRHGTLGCRCDECKSETARLLRGR